MLKFVHIPKDDWLSWLERILHMNQVAGSNPASSTTDYFPVLPPPDPELFLGLGRMMETPLWRPGLY